MRSDFPRWLRTQMPGLVFSCLGQLTRPTPPHRLPHRLGRLFPKEINSCEENSVTHIHSDSPPPAPYLPSSVIQAWPHSHTPHTSQAWSSSFDQSLLETGDLPLLGRTTIEFFHVKLHHPGKTSRRCHYTL